MAGHASGARIISAATIEEAAVIDLFADRAESRRDLAFDPATGAVTATHSRRLGAIRLSVVPDPEPNREAVSAALIEGIRVHGLHLLPWSDEAVALRQRAQFARAFDPAVPALDDDALIARLDEWLPPLIAGKRKLGDVDPHQLRQQLIGLLGFEARSAVDRLAPAEFVSPAGSRHAIDYSNPERPTVEVRAQALFGLTSHPGVAGGRVPLALAITSPAGRPIQTTRDLPAFWSGSWRDVAKEMRGRYPRHPWPDDPAAAAATLKSKRAAG